MSLFGKARKSLRYNLINAGRAVTCGARFQGLRPETQAVLVVTVFTLPSPLPEFLIVVNQDEAKCTKQCHCLENDADLFVQIEQQQLFLITADAAAAVDASTNEKHLVFHRGINEGVLYQRSEDPASNLYVTVPYHDEVMIMHSAMMIKKAFKLAGAQSIRSRVAHAGRKSTADAFKVNGEFLGTGGGVEMSGNDADSTKDEGMWNEKHLWTHHPFEVLPENERYFLRKLDSFLEDGPVLGALQDIVKSNKPVYTDFEVLVTHERTSDKVRNLSLKVSARFFPDNKFEPGTGGGIDHSKSSSSAVEYVRELECAFFTTIKLLKHTPSSPLPDRFVRLGCG
jgi:hypothetical protein